MAKWRRDVAPTVIAMAGEMGFLVAADLQRRQAAAVAKHDGLRRHTARGRVEAHLARMLAFDFEPGVKEWRRAC